MASIEPSQFNELIAVHRVQPFGDEQLTRLVQQVLAAQGAEVEWQDLREREEQAELSDEDRQRQMDSIFGVRR